jgi:hypothetical protein
MLQYIALWLSKVPSKNNIADETSRGVTAGLLKRGF